MSVLVDTCILIDALRCRTPAQHEVATRLQALPLEGVAPVVSVVTWTELFAGARPGESDRITAVLDQMQTVAIDVEIARLAGDFLRKYRASHAIELGDALVAAVAVRHGHALWTHNWKHFPMPELVRFEAV